MLVYLVCCNDRVEYAVINDENKAEKKMEELKRIDYREKAAFYSSVDEYNSICFWHTHAVYGE